MPRLRTHSSSLLVAAPLILALAGCGDGDSITGLGSDFDAESTAQSVTGIGDAAARNPALIQLGLAGQALGQGIVASAAPGLERFNLLGDAALYRIVAGGAGQPPIFPTNFLGKTFVWDPATGTYVIDEGLAGAPADGVRFLLYELDPATELPGTPLVQVGYLDIVDGSTPSSTRLEIRAVDTSGGSDVTLLDYFIDGSYSVSTEAFALTFASAGFISDGVDRIDFSLDQSLSLGEGLQSIDVSLLHQISAPALGVSVTLAVNGQFSAANENEGTLAASLTIADGSDSAVLGVQVAAETIDGQLSYNGETVVLISGAADEPEFTAPDGGPIGEAEVAALEEIFGTIDELMQFAEDLFGPLAELFGVES